MALIRQFEYAIKEFKGGVCWNSKETITALNNYGLDGWELVKLSASNRCMFPWMALMKRLKGEYLD